MSETYIDALLAGSATMDDFRAYVEAWHRADFPEGQAVPEVYEFLGLTWDEYRFVALDETRLRYVAAARRHNQPLDAFEQSAGQLALAARAGDSRELSELVAYLVDQGVLE
ncbi:hypothetical protein [Intrasporangium flavum]|uniref:hypothetical protein n=1 Tax=Intrasporangium flavum TaxID=1428657 RepID=UPI00096D9D03|nr:hypothetical protein [Intrasporangium flavum]